MIVYSKKIILFITEIKRIVKDVLSKEIHLRVAGDRFYDKREAVSYPIKIVIYNHKSMLGYFEPHFYELGFHECLMHTSPQQLRNVVRHELAHYITSTLYGEGIQAHGVEFRAFCEKMGWGEEVYKATTCLEEGPLAVPIEENPVLRRIQKLMALANSSNKNEAESAMIKSQQLLLKHNIESKYMGGEEEERLFLKRIMEQKKENAKMRSIARILETFFVNVVYQRARGFICLEILGNAVNVEIADHVATILDSQLEQLWEEARKNFRLKGAIAKNSFFLGLAKGYCDKIRALKRDYDTTVSQALMVIEKQLIDAQSMVYPRLSSGRSHGSHCAESAALGQQMGRQLNINPALKQSSKESGALIGY